MMNVFTNKKIIMWGLGVLQVDIEAIYHLDKVYAYIEDELDDSKCINVKKEDVISSDNIAIFKGKEVMFVLCTKDKDYAIRKLEGNGFTRANYVLGEELLTNKELYDDFCSYDITIYGAGNTYLYWKKELSECDIRIQRFAVTKKTYPVFDGKEVVSLEELKALKNKTKIIVSSIYYKEIYDSLQNAGFEAGNDFMQLDTFLALYHLTENINSDYEFINRSHNYKKLLVVLSGYKEFVWESVFARLEKYLPDGIDVCIATSGKDDFKMRELCEKNEWSYLSTKKNNVSLVTNLAISLHYAAEYIYKMDEDIFLTEGTFETLIDTYIKVEEKSEYEVGFVTPIIPVNGYGYVRILDILEINDIWKSKFGEIKITDCYKHHMTIHDNPAAAEFLWGRENKALRNIDELQKNLQTRHFSYSICPVRYSIGFILFHRDNWIRMGMFPVKEYENMGADEKRICEFCMMEGRTMVVSENCIAGHLSYGPQHQVMQQYYYDNRDLFDLPVKK